jgi:small ubiquitin-related modifier
VHWEALQELSLPDGISIPFSILSMSAPTLKILMMCCSEDNPPRHPTVERLAMCDWTEAMLDDLTTGTPKLQFLELRKCTLKLTVHSFDQLKVRHPALESVHFRQSFHLYDIRNYSNFKMLPDPSYAEEDSRDFTILMADMKLHLQSHIPDTVKVRVKDQGGDETFFKMKITTKMNKVFRAYAQRKRVAITSLRFLIDGERIDPAETALSLELQLSHDPDTMGGDQLDCLLEQRGD